MEIIEGKTLYLGEIDAAELREVEINLTSPKKESKVVQTQRDIADPPPFSSLSLSTSVMMLSMVQGVGLFPPASLYISHLIGSLH